MPRGPLGVPRITDFGPFVRGGRNNSDPNIDLYNGDAVSVSNKLSSNNVTVDALITDPPYGVDIRSMGKISGEITNDKNIKTALGLFDETMGSAVGMLRDGSAQLIFGGQKSICDFRSEIVKKNLDVHDILIWNKIVSGPPFDDINWRHQYEMIIYSINGNPSFVNTHSTDGDVLNFRRIIPNQHVQKRHPTEKPIDLMEYLIESITDEGDLVFDPFMGSGSTGVAAKDLNRDFIGIEIEPELFDVAKNRING